MANRLQTLPNSNDYKPIKTIFMLNLKKQRRPQKDIKLIAVKNTGESEAIYKADNRVFYAEIQEDMDGEFYFLHMNKAQYLPQEFQQH